MDHPNQAQGGAEPYHTKPVEPNEKWGGPPPLIDSPIVQRPYHTNPV